MSDDIEFTRLADAFMADIYDKLETQDPDEVEADFAMGVVTMEFADGTKCIMNRQTAAHQIWLAYSATAWHFALEGDAWVDTKGRGTLTRVLSEVLAEKLGHPVPL